MRNSLARIPALALVALATPAVAHTGHGVHFAVVDGLLHPLNGVDHLLAMLAVGFWAAQLGGRAIWLLPTGFVTAMSVGAGLADLGVSGIGIETLILSSVVGLGSAIALAATPPLAVALGVSALFALAHGQAHGLEVPEGVGLGGYMAGFVVTTTLLHLAGLAGGLSLRARPGVGRTFGLLIAASGLVLATAA